MSGSNTDPALKERSSDSEGSAQNGTHTEDLEKIHTFERVGTHAEYYEKGGLRTEGDGVDHQASHHKLNFKTWMALTAMSFLWTASQIPVYLFGGIAPRIYQSIGGVDRWIWFVLGNLLALAAICPFVGALSDLFGRRYVAIGGASFIILGMIVCSTANDMNTFIGGMVLAGIGAGVNELTALAGTSELAPTSKRGLYVGMMVFTIAPWTPSVLYGQIIDHASSFRYVGLLCGLWAFIGLVLTVIFYHPPPRPNSQGYERKEILKRIDYVGGLLSISGSILFMAGLEWGGYQYSWSQAHTLAPLIIGFFLLVGFVLWEIYGAKYPMIPRRLGKNSRVLTATFVITFISGANFFSILFFWPTQAFNMYGDNYIGVGLRGLPIGISILVGAVLFLILIGVTKGKIQLLMICASIIMTAGTGSMSVATPVNLSTMWGLVILAGLGIGGIVVPASIISTIVCPDDLIATITALTLSVRVLGGALGYTIYYNVFINKFMAAAKVVVGKNAFGQIIENSASAPYSQQIWLLNQTHITELITLAGNAQFIPLRALIDEHLSKVPYTYEIIISATQWAFADAYKWVYWISIAFGAVSIIASCFLGDISQFLDDHVAVVME